MSRKNIPNTIFPPLSCIIPYLRFIIFLPLFPFILKSQSNMPVHPEAELKKLAGEFSFTEGPAVDSLGNIFFTDQPNNKIYQWSTHGKLSTFLSESGRSNGLYFDKNGYLIACADMDNQLWRIDTHGNHTVLIKNHQNKLLNGPNDVWVHPNGSIYFTDPLYKRPYWVRNPEMQQEGQYVYYLSEEKNKFFPVAKGFVRPNGIIGTPDGKIIYVADIGDNKIYKFKIRKNGKLSKRELFVEMGSDGMTIDEAGNIYLTGKGVTIFNPEGIKIGHIEVPEKWTANVCFGGVDMNILFITASESLYSIKMNVSGVP